MSHACLRPAISTTLLLIVAVTLGGPVAMRAQSPTALTTDDFFDDTVVHDIELVASSRDWATLKQRFLENTYYPCTFSWNGITVRNATMRSRGSYTRNGQKPGLRVDFNRFDSSQRFLGLKYFVLDNFWQEASMMKERLSMRLFERLGVAVPREAYARLFVNGEYVGMYAIVEAPDDVFTGRAFGDTTGYIYEYNWESEYRFEYLGPDLKCYKCFDPKTHSKDPASLVWGPIEQMMQAINDTPDAIFEREVSTHVDLAGFVKQAAIESFLAEKDGLLGDWGVDNFYLFRPVDSLRFRFMEWDKDSTFDSADRPILKGVAENVLARRTLQIPAYLNLYLDTLLAAANSAAELAAPRPTPLAREVGGHTRVRQDTTQPGWLEREIASQFRQIVGFAREDPFKSGSNEDMDFAVQQLLRFAAERPTFVRQEVARLRGLDIAVPRKR